VLNNFDSSPLEMELSSFATQNIDEAGQIDSVSCPLIVLLLLAGQKLNDWRNNVLSVRGKRR
jgi:hypothetical protein